MIDKSPDKVIMADAVEKRLRFILNEGSKNLMDFENMKPELPPFYDEKKFRLGQQAFYNNIFSMMIAKLCGLVSLLSITTILDVVMFTKKSGTPCLAYRRYAETILHTFVWHEKDPNGKPNEFLESLKIVRRKHCIAFKRSTEAGVHKPTQLDMVLSQFGFIGYTIISEKYLGIKVTPEEMEGVVHLWRVIGSMLGIDDKFNLCSGTVEETRALCQRLLEDVFIPCLANRGEHFDHMNAAMLQGLWPICFNIEPLSFTAFTFYLASSTARNNNYSIEMDTSTMPFYSWYLFNLQHFVLKYLLRPSAWWSSFFRAILNAFMRHSIFLLKTFPYLAYWKFGKQYAKVKFGYGVAFTLAVFEAKRLLVLALEIFAEWQVIRIAGGFQPVALTLADVTLGLPCALIIVRTIRRRKSNLRPKTRRVLKCLLTMIIVCIAMNMTTLGLIGYDISVRQETLVKIFNASMHLYATVASYKYAIDEIQFVLQCCGHSSYTDWFLFDWQKVDYASREEMAGQNRISDEDYRGLGVPFSCCNLRAAAPCMHLEMTDDKTINVNGCAEVISPILLRIVIVACIMTLTLIIIQVLLAFLITRIIYRCVPLRTSFPQVRRTAAPFSTMNTSSRTYVSRLFSLKKSAWRKRPSMQCYPLTIKDVFTKETKENRKIKPSKIRCRYPILNQGNHTWDVAKIKPSVHEEHRISMECLRNKCAS